MRSFEYSYPHMNAWLGDQSVGGGGGGGGGGGLGGGGGQQPGSASRWKTRKGCKVASLTEVRNKCIV